ncbi:hypothetical protein HaLaN_27537, partial [Haematococcus lacustris]
CAQPYTAAAVPHVTSKEAEAQPGGLAAPHPSPCDATGPNKHQQQPARPLNNILNASLAALPPGGGMFWQQGPDGNNRPKTLDINVLRTALGRMKSFFNRRGRRDGNCIAPDVGHEVMKGSVYPDGVFKRVHLTKYEVFFFPMGGRLIAVYPRQDIFVIFCPRGEGLTTDEESNLVEFLNANVKQTEWEVIDGTCPQQTDDWSDELRMLIHMEYLWRRSFRRNSVQTGIRYDAKRMLARQRLLQCTLETEGEWCSLIDVHPKWKNRAPSDMADPLSVSHPH